MRIVYKSIKDRINEALVAVDTNPQINRSMIKYIELTSEEYDELRSLQPASWLFDNGAKNTNTYYDGIELRISD